MAVNELIGSGFLQRLASQAAAAGTQLEVDCLAAERAMYQARRGHVDEVSVTLVKLRRLYDSRPNARVSTWVNLCEGMTSQFNDMSPRLADKIRRAHALSESADLTSLCALSSAWLAHAEYLGANFESMALHVDQALRLSKKDNHGALSRASLAVAQAFHFAGRLDLAQGWYASVRRHAVAEGDDAAMSALLHTMASMRASTLRQNILLQGAAGCDDQHALISADSALRFDAMVGLTRHVSSISILRAQILSAVGQAEIALCLYDAHLTSAKTEGLGSTQEADLLADRAWCQVSVGDLDAAAETSASALACLGTQANFVDRALAHKRLAQVFHALGDTESSTCQQDLASAAWVSHREVQMRIVELLAHTSSAPETH